MQNNGNKKPLIIAHRGASAIAPENTLAAFRRAIKDGAEGIEFDVRLAGDGVPVVFHDAELNRVGCCEGRVIDFSSEQLQKLDVGSWFNEKKPKNYNSAFSKETVSTLRQTLEFLKDYKGLIYVEIKCRKGEIQTLVKAVCEEVKKFKFSENIIVKSFKLEVIPRIRQICPDIKTAALFAPKIMNILQKEKNLLTLADELGAHQISLHYSLVTGSLMKKINEKKVPLTIWTVDNPLWVKRALNLGVGAIITNNPARMLAKRHGILHKNSILA